MTAEDAAFRVLDLFRTYLGFEPKPGAIELRWNPFRTRDFLRELLGLDRKGGAIELRWAAEEFTAEQIASRVLQDRVWYDKYRKDAAHALREGKISEPLLAFAAGVLDGEPPPKGKKQPDHELILVIGLAVESASAITGKIYRNDASFHADSACDAVVAAAERLGKPMTYEQVAHRFRNYRAAHKKLNSHKRNR